MVYRKGGQGCGLGRQLSGRAHDWHIGPSTKKILEIWTMLRVGSVKLSWKYSFMKVLEDTCIISSVSLLGFRCHSVTHYCCLNGASIAKWQLSLRTCLMGDKTTQAFKCAWIELYTVPSGKHTSSAKHLKLDATVAMTLDVAGLQGLTLIMSHPTVLKRCLLHTPLSSICSSQGLCCSF